MKPVVIAIPETGNSPYQKYLKRKYVRSLQRADAAARWIDLTDPESAVKEALDSDGLLQAVQTSILPYMAGKGLKNAENQIRCGIWLNR